MTITFLCLVLLVTALAAAESPGSCTPDIIALCQSGTDETQCCDAGDNVKCCTESEKATQEASSGPDMPSWATTLIITGVFVSAVPIICCFIDCCTQLKRIKSAAINGIYHNDPRYNDSRLQLSSREPVLLTRTSISSETSTPVHMYPGSRQVTPIRKVATTSCIHQGPSRSATIDRCSSQPRVQLYPPMSSADHRSVTLDRKGGVGYINV